MSSTGSAFWRARTVVWAGVWTVTVNTCADAESRRYQSTSPSTPKVARSGCRARDGGRADRDVVGFAGAETGQREVGGDRSTEGSGRVDDPVTVVGVNAARSRVTGGGSEPVANLGLGERGILRPHEGSDAGHDRGGKGRAVAGRVAAARVGGGDVEAGGGHVEPVAVRLKSTSFPAGSVAPTAITSGNAAGYWARVVPGVAAPRRPPRRCARYGILDRGMQQSAECGPPSERLMTRAPWSTAQTMPVATSES